ncbi:MAG: PAS domain-containing protein [Mesorhizobium sp.]
MTDPQKGIYPAGTPVGLAGLAANGRITSADGAMSRILGRESPDLIGRPLADLASPANRDSLLAAFASIARTGEEQSLEVDFNRRDGNVRVEVRLHKVAGEGAAAPILAVLIDISEHIEAGAVLRDREERLRSALDAAQMGTFVWHIDEGRTEPDTQMRSLFGVDGDAVLSLDARSISNIVPDDRKRYSAAVSRACHPDGDGVCRKT